MKIAATGMVSLLLVFGGLSAQKAPNFSVRDGETFTGEITDSFCAEDGQHIGMFKNEKSCIFYVRQVRRRTIRALQL
jgi:hypothetical protein